MKKQKLPKDDKMKCYKVFNPDWTCNGFRYEIGKTYLMKEEPILCKRGFHACKEASDCFSYYDFNPRNKIAEVILSGKIIGKNGNKQASNKIRIVKEITWGKMLELANIGIGNSGYRNSGNCNSGNQNSGNYNSGNCNSGNQNSGNQNSGNCNSGYCNSGNCNSGYRNSGYRNSGNYNSGNQNSGNCNSGNQNSGNCNSGNYNSGYFNSITPDEILVFNKPCKKSDWEDIDKPLFISCINITQWISWLDMSDEEKKENNNAFVTGGYLKSISYKEAWKLAFDSENKEDIKLLKALPNFDAKVFEKITGIRI